MLGRLEGEIVILCDLRATRQLRDGVNNWIRLTWNRRTGITLKERQRDEHGFEIIDGSMFESPEKSPPKRNGAVGKDSDQSESMDVQESMFTPMRRCSSYTSL